MLMSTDNGCSYENKLGQSLCATNDWTLAYLRKFAECPSYSPFILWMSKLSE